MAISLPAVGRNGFLILAKPGAMLMLGREADDRRNEQESYDDPKDKPSFNGARCMLDVGLSDELFFVCFP